MSGSTSSTNILNAINEVIKALNDLTLTCSPTTNVSSSAPSVVVNCSCGGGGSTTSDPPFIPPDVNPTEGGTSPSGFEQPTEIDSRKCKAANYLYDGTLEVLTKFSVYGVEDYINLGIGYLITMIAFLISALAALGGAIGSFAAYLSGIGGGSVIASTLSAQGASISALTTAWEENHSEIVCALYNATAARPAIDAVSDVLSNAGLSSVNVAVFKAIFTVEVATILFFKPAMKGVTIEQDLDGYTATVDCANCGGCGMYIELGTDKAVDGDSASAAAQAVYSSYYGFDIYYMRVYLSSTSGEACGENRTSSVNITSGTLTVVNATYDKFYTYFDDVGLTLPHQFDTPDTTNDYAVIQIQSRTAFSATVTRT